ncbi:MAG: hypothetical protein DRP82_03640 [Planctomycetota bacterium]|nr:MAG: hypothetical protein DRP82_03640 [Planctomycetota bacterium]
MAAEEKIRAEVEKRFGERLRFCGVRQEGCRLICLVVVDDLSEREEYRLYRLAAELTRSVGLVVVFAPYSSSDFKRRRNLPFESSFGEVEL